MNSIQIVGRFAVVVLLAIVASSCSSVVQRDSPDSCFVYGQLKGAMGNDNLQSIYLEGVSDDGKRVSKSARFITGGIYFIPNVPAGRYTLTEIHYKTGYGNSTYYLQKQGSYYAQKSDVKNGFDILPGEIYFVGQLVMTNTDDRHFSITLESAAYLGRDLLTVILDRLKEGPWFDAVQGELDKQ